MSFLFCPRPLFECSSGSSYPCTSAAHETTESVTVLAPKVSKPSRCQDDDFFSLSLCQSHAVAHTEMGRCFFPSPPPRWHSEPGECKQYCIRPRTQSLKTQLLGFSSSSRSDLPLSLVRSLPTFHHHHTSQKMASSLLQPKIVTLMQINSKKPAACCLF